MEKPPITLSTPYRWLGEALVMCRQHPAAFMGASSVLLVVGLLPTILQRVAASILPQTLILQALVYVLFSMLLLPPIIGSGDTCANRPKARTVKMSATAFCSRYSGTEATTGSSLVSQPIVQASAATVSRVFPTSVHEP